MEENTNHDSSDEFQSTRSHLMESKTTQLDDLLNEKLERAFHKPTSLVLLHDVAKIASEHDPIDLAYAVSRLPNYARLVVYENLPDLESKIIFIVNTGSNTRSVIFRQVDNKEIKNLIEKMPPDEAVEVLDDLSDRRLRKVLTMLEPKKRTHIRELQRHDRHSAGRMMNNEFFSFHMNDTIGEVAKHIRDNPGIDLGHGIFVVTKSRELIGFVPERNLVVNPPYLPIRQVMQPIVHTVTPDASRDEVVDIVERYEIPNVPVVDNQGKLVGVIVYQEVVEAMEDIADETIATIAGTGEDISEHEPIVKRFFWRAPWLVVTLCAGLFTSTVMSYFEGKEWFAILPFFVPLIAGMSGNIGLQCSTVLVRSMAIGEITSGSRKEVMIKELAIGLLIGVVFGIFCGTLVMILNYFDIQHFEADPRTLGVLVGFGVFAASLSATLLGTFSPFFFVHIGVDPAVAAGPIVTAFNDVFSVLAFFVVSYFIFSFLG
ncbi:MAG: magnesium transporter [Waddliaceae bacterium]